MGERDTFYKFIKPRSYITAGMTDMIILLFLLIPQRLLCR